jgi:hypothetical protein
MLARHRQLDPGAGDHFGLMPGSQPFLEQYANALPCNARDLFVGFGRDTTSQGLEKQLRLAVVESAKSR